MQGTAVCCGAAWFGFSTPLSWRIQRWRIYWFQSVGDSLLTRFLSGPEMNLFPVSSNSARLCFPDRLSILVVDDEKNVREGLAKVLEYKGYRTAVAPGASTALEILGDRRFDAVITDLRMPELDGLAFLQKAKEEWPELHFILMTAYGEIRSYLDARQYGAVEYFNKPVRIDELIAVLSRLRPGKTRTLRR